MSVASASMGSLASDRRSGSMSVASEANPLFRNGDEPSSTDEEDSDSAEASVCCGRPQLAVPGPVIFGALGEIKRTRNLVPKAATPEELLFDLTVPTSLAAAAQGLRCTVRYSGECEFDPKLGLVEYMQITLTLFTLWLNFTTNSARVKGNTVFERYLLLSLAIVLIVQAMHTKFLYAQHGTGIVKATDICQNYTASVLSFILLVLAYDVRTAYYLPRARRATAFTTCWGVILLIPLWVTVHEHCGTEQLSTFLWLGTGAMLLQMPAALMAKLVCGLKPLPIHHPFLLGRLSRMMLIVLGQGVASFSIRATHPEMDNKIRTATILLNTSGCIISVGIFSLYFSMATPLDSRLEDHALRYNAFKGHLWLLLHTLFYSLVALFAVTAGPVVQAGVEKYEFQREHEKFNNSETQRQLRNSETYAEHAISNTSNAVVAIVLLLCVFRLLHRQFSWRLTALFIAVHIGISGIVFWIGQRGSTLQPGFVASVGPVCMFTLGLSMRYLNETYDVRLSHQVNHNLTPLVAHADQCKEQILNAYGHANAVALYDDALFRAECLSKDERPLVLELIAVLTEVKDAIRLTLNDEFSPERTETFLRLLFKLSEGDVDREDFQKCLKTSRRLGHIAGMVRNLTSVESWGSRSGTVTSHDAMHNRISTTV